MMYPSRQPHVFTSSPARHTFRITSVDRFLQGEPGVRRTSNILSISRNSAGLAAPCLWTSNCGFEVASSRPHRSIQRLAWEISYLAGRSAFPLVKPFGSRSTCQGFGEGISEIGSTEQVLSP